MGDIDPIGNTPTYYNIAPMYQHRYEYMKYGRMFADWGYDTGITTKPTIMASLTEKFALAFKGEPEKSFIKAGVMNQNETLTTEGQAVFMAWLLKANGAAFKKEVVDPILAEEEAK